MTQFAKFPPGQYNCSFVDFEPHAWDYERTNSKGAKCYFHDGYWYVPYNKGLPQTTTATPLWGNPLGATLAPSPVTPDDYPDGNPKSLQGAKKFSLRYFPLSANVEVNRALEDGAKKYGAANWREKGVATSVYVDAALRHIHQYFDCKEDNASDSGVHNLGHAMACLAIIIDAEKAGTLKDDRPFPFPNGDNLLLRK